MGDVTIKTDDLQYIDLTRFGSFSQSENLNDFLATPRGEAQYKSLVDGMKEQALEQGNENYEPEEGSVRRAIFHAQAQQNYGQGMNIITDDEMLSKDSLPWYEELWQLKNEWVKAVGETIDDTLEPYGPASSNPDDEPYVGKAGAARAEVIDSAVLNIIRP